MYSIVHLEEDQKRILFRNTAQKAGLHEAISGSFRISRMDLPGRIQPLKEEARRILSAAPTAQTVRTPRRFRLFPREWPSPFLKQR